MRTSLDTGSTTTSVVAIHLLGAPRVSGPGAEALADLLGKPKAFALLAYLAMAAPGAYRRRDDTLALFWPESDTTRARNALRQGLFQLRQHLPGGALLVQGQEGIALSPAAVQTDLAEFSLQLAAGDERAALDQYQGPLLDGFSLYEGSGFAAWLAMERDRIHRQAMRAAIALAERAAAAQVTADVGHWVRFAIDRSPYDEDLLRASLGLLQSVGDRASATELYHAAVRRFRMGLDIALSPETERAGAAHMTAASRRRASDNASIPMPPSVGAPGFPVAPTVPRTPRAVSPEARRLHLQARALAGQRSPLTIMNAIDTFERAIRLSPDYAEAHAGLGFALCQAAVYVDYPGADVWARAKAHAARASRLDPGLGEAHAVLAHVTLCYDYGWQAADGLYQKALAVDPTSTVTRHSYALYYLAAAGRTDEALALLDRARDDTPDNPAHSVYYALCCTFGRRFERARQEADFVLDAHPALVQAHWVRGMADEAMGDLPGAIASFERTVAMTGRSSMFLSQLGRAYASAGEHARARAILDELDGRGTDSAPALYNSAEIFAAMGEHERALDCLYSAYRQRNPYVIFAGVKYALDPLRNTKRFRDLMARMSVPRTIPAIIPPATR